MRQDSIPCSCVFYLHQALMGGWEEPEYAGSLCVILLALGHGGWGDWRHLLELKKAPEYSSLLHGQHHVTGMNSLDGSSTRLPF
jgi:hypothetical protein